LKLNEEAKMKKKSTKGWALAAVGLGMMAGNAPAMPLPEVIPQGHSFQIAQATFTDSNLPELLDLHGLPKVMADGLAPLAHEGNANTSLIAPYTPNRAAIMSEMVLSGDNTANVVEPVTMLLFGAGLAGLASLSSPPRSNKSAP
jgi:hypothetical protein